VCGCGRPGLEHELALIRARLDADPAQSIEVHLDGVTSPVFENWKPVREGLAPPAPGAFGRHARAYR
jgi:hypothetical protein